MVWQGWLVVVVYLWAVMVGGGGVPVAGMVSGGGVPVAGMVGRHETIMLFLKPILLFPDSPNFTYYSPNKIFSQ